MKHPLHVVGLVLATAFSLRADSTPTNDLGEVARQALAQVQPYLVRIEPAGQTSKTKSWSGLYLGERGEIITAWPGKDQEPPAVVIETSTGEKLPGTIVRRDFIHSIALIRVNDPSRLMSIRPITAVPRSQIVAGLSVWTVGSLVPQAPVLSMGMVSAVDRVWGRAVQIDAKTSPVNDGGPAIDRTGRVLGIIVPIDPLGSKNQSLAYDSGVGFVIPFEEILAQIETLRKEDVHVGLTGIVWDESGGFISPPVVQDVAWKSPAERAGIMPGDIVTHIATKPTPYRHQVLQQLGSLKAGSAMNVSLLRASKTVETKMVLATEVPTYAWPSTGMVLLEQKDRIVVTHVLAQSSADRAGIEPGSLLVSLGKKKVTSLAAVRSLLDQFAVGETVDAEVRSTRGTAQHSLTIEEALRSIPRLSFDRPLPANAQEAAVSEIKHEDSSALVRLPRRLKGESLGLVLLLGLPTIAGLTDVDWDRAADRYGWILVHYRAEAGQRWPPGEISRVHPLLTQSLERDEIDRNRVMVVGAGPSAETASALVDLERNRVRGLIIVNGAVQLRSSMKPTERLAILQFQSDGKTLRPSNVGNRPVVVRNTNDPPFLDEMGTWSLLLGRLY